MDKLTDKVFSEITNAQSDYCASIYMPTYRKGQESTQSPTRLKNLVRQTRSMLEERGMKESDIDALVKPAEDLYMNSIFWQKQSDGLAMFLSKEHEFIYRLPVRFDEDVVIAPKFHLKPLFPIYNNLGSYNILSLSKSNVRLFEANQYDIEEIDLTDLDIPLSLDEALKFDVTHEHVSHHSAQPGNRTGSSIFYGQGGEEDDKENIRYFFQLVEDSLSKVITEGPLVLAGVDYILAIYRNVSNYKDICENAILGSPDEKTPEELHKESYDIIQPILAKPLKEDLELYNQLLGQKSSKVSNEVSSILKAAFSGKVKTAFLKSGKKIWGTFDEETLQVTFADEIKLEHVDLLDLIARYTHINSGDVYVLKENQYSDERKDAFAIYRY
ncbi:MAG: hypothetical protein ACOCRO_10615 [Halanaerobiales bacterium]